MVTEALWKKKPTIVGAVGGIPNQIAHRLTGSLVHEESEVGIKKSRESQEVPGTPLGW